MCLKWLPQSSNCTLERLSQRNWNLCLHKEIFLNVPQPPTGNNSNVLHGWVFKQTVVHPYHKILLNNKKGTSYGNTQLRWILKKLGLVKKTQPISGYNCMIPLYSVVEMTKVETNNRLEVARDLEGRRVKGN